MEWFNYLLKVSVCSALFFAFYLLILRRLTFFKINRFYLLFTLLLSFIIPALHFTLEREVVVAPLVETPIMVQNENATEQFDIAPITAIEQSFSIKEPFDWINLLPYLYLTIVTILLAIATWRLYQLIKHAKQITQEINGLKLVPKSVGFTNCSFFNYVFIDENSLTKNEIEVLLRHEEVHAKQFHSVDKIMLIIAKAVLWFNPIVYLYDKALEQIHEYEADELTSQNFGTAPYANLLLRLAVAKSNMPLVHNFVKSPIKERIKMLYHSKSKQMKKLLYLLALPIGMGLLWGFTVKVVEVLPKTEKEFTLILDAGHGGKESGAEVNGYKEKDIALAFTKKIKTLAETKGIKVVTTRTNDENLSLADRLKTQGDFLLSIHVNSEPIKTSGLRNGIEMYTPTSDKKLNWFKSTSISYNLYQNLKTVAGIKTNNKPFQKKLFLLQNSSTAGLVLEMGYLTNNQDLKIITDETKQAELAEAIVNAVLRYKKYLKTDKEIEMNFTGETLQTPPKVIQQNAPFIQRSKLNGKTENGSGTIVITANNKTVGKIGSSDPDNIKLYFYINRKLYTEAEAMKFTPQFIAQLGNVYGVGNTKNNYTVPNVETNRNNFIVWFGTEPQFSVAYLKNKTIYEKYNGTTITGEIIDFSFDNNKNLDGFLVKTITGDKVMAKVEIRFTKEINAMIAKGDKVTLKIYNANYYQNIPYPWVTSYKISKGGKLLFDKWPKVADLKNKSLPNRFYDKDGAQKVKEEKIVLKTSNNVASIKPILSRSSSLRIDTKADITYIKNGLFELGEKQLEGEEIAYDKRNEKLTVKNGKLKLENGSFVSEKYIIYDLKKNSYTTNKTPGNQILVNSVGSDFLTALKIENDSLKLFKIFDQSRMLSGKIAVKGVDFILNAKILEADPNSNLIKAHLATVYLNNGQKLSGDIIEYDIMSKSYKITTPIDFLYKR